MGATMTSITTKQDKETGFGFKPRRPLETNRELEYAYAINSEADYNQAVARLAADLLNNHTPQQVAEVAAMHIIYVDTLKVRGDTLESLTDTLKRENKQKISKHEFMQMAKTLWKKAQALNPSKGGSARHEKDPKSKEKNFVFQCWLDWKKEPGRYKSNAAFARDMLAKCQFLESTKVIEGWCTDWGKKNPASRVGT